jgi:hypothetical protein
MSDLTDASLPPTTAKALEMAALLVKQWPHDSSHVLATCLETLAGALQQYPLSIGEKCCDPRIGLVRTREQFPSVPAIHEWCEARQNDLWRPEPFLPDQSFASVWAKLVVDLGENITAAWFKNASLKVVGDTGQIVLPTKFIRRYVKDNFETQLLRASRSEHPEVVRLEFKVAAVQAAE